MLLIGHADGELLRAAVAYTGTASGKKRQNYEQRRRAIKEDGLTVVFYGRNDAEPIVTFTIPGVVMFAFVKSGVYEVFSEDFEHRLVLQLRADPTVPRGRTLFWTKVSAGTQKQVDKLEP